MANCKNCGAPLHADRSAGGLVCGHCGTQEESPAIVQQLQIGAETSRLCPTCAAPLSESRLADYSLDLCQRCLGMLIDMKHFASVVEIARAHEEGPLNITLPRRQNPGDRALACPRCAQRMLSHFYEGPGNLVIDTCERCLVNWLDPGELRRIARAPQGRVED